MLYSHLQRHNDKDAGRKTHDKDAGRTSLQIYFTSHFIARFACERVLETEHKLHILTPLLWPSHCVFLVLLDAQPEVLGSTRVWPSLPHLVSTVWKSAGNCIGGFRGPPQSGVAFPTTSGLYWQLLWDPNSTELNNNSTPTRSPTGSLKSNV